MVGEYLNAAASAVQNYRAVSALQGFFVWGMFLWYTEPMGKKYREQKQELLLQAAFFLVSSLIFMKNFRMIIHLPLFLLICVLYLKLETSVTFSGAVFKLCPFILSAELCRLISHDGIMTAMLSGRFGTYSAFASVCFSKAVYLCSLLLNVWLLRKLMNHVEKLEVSIPQILCFILPLAVYIVVRHYVFSYSETLELSMWLKTELLQISIILCAELSNITAGRMAAVQIERKELIEKQILQEKRQQQYLLQKESIEAVNRRYHDLKHFLSALESMNTSEVNDSFLKIKREVESYESMQKTGNRTLDLLLAERIRECQQKGIRLIPYVDGRAISFLNVVDLCVIFGNAMDNAIEATESLKYVNMKEINLKIGISGQMLLFHFRNYFEGERRWDGERLLTGKEKDGSHGYGLQNIREAAAKYGGTVAYDILDSEFSLNILIPLPGNGK